MKKVFESTVSQITPESWAEHDGEVDYVADPFDGDTINLNEPVKLEKGQEALFKITVTTTVELIDVRMAEAWSKAEVAAVEAKAKEIEPLFHADGCGFFYGNPCRCGFETAPIPVRTGIVMVNPKLLPVDPELRKAYLYGTWEAEQLQTTQAPAKRLVWHCDACNSPFPSAVTLGFGENSRGYLTCQKCNCGREHTLKVLKPEEKPKYEWWCYVCRRTEAHPDLKEKHVGDLGNCVVCANGSPPQRKTMTVRTAPRPA